MRKINIIYWIATGLMSVFILPGAVFNLISEPKGVQYIAHLGYPAYLVPFLGAAKLAAIIVILIPGLNRLKEWAYAGLVFDVVGAIYSHICTGEPASTWAPIFIGLGIIAVSYLYHHKRITVA